MCAYAEVGLTAPHVCREVLAVQVLMLVAVLQVCCANLFCVRSSSPFSASNLLTLHHSTDLLLTDKEDFNLSSFQAKLDLILHQYPVQYSCCLCLANLRIIWDDAL